MTIQEELAQYEKKVADAKQQMAQAQGSLNTIMENLKTNHDCSTLEEAEALRLQMAEQIATTEAELNMLMDQLRAAFKLAGVEL